MRASPAVAIHENVKEQLQQQMGAVTVILNGRLQKASAGKEDADMLRLMLTAAMHTCRQA